MVLRSPPALTVLCASAEEKGVERSVCESAGVSLKHWYTVEAKHIWTVSNIWLFCADQHIGF